MYQKECEKAVEAALLAGEVIRKYADTDMKVMQKGPDHPVTIADQEADACIQKTLLEAFPLDGWLSEETKDSADRLSKNRVWIVDPLDGTKEFINHLPEYAVSIALVENGQPVVGVIYNVANNELYRAVVGKGAFKNDGPIQTTQQSELLSAHILASRSELKRGEWERYEEQMVVTPAGGMAHKMVMVAEGKADGSFTLQPKTEWDFAAGILIIQEAGGKVSQLNGAPFTLNQENPKVPGLLFGGAIIFPVLLDIVKSATS